MARPRKNITPEILIELFHSYHDWTIIAKVLGVGRSTVYRRLKEFGIAKEYTWQ